MINQHMSRAIIHSQHFSQESEIPPPLSPSAKCYIVTLAFLTPPAKNYMETLIIWLDGGPDEKQSLRRMI